MSHDELVDIGFHKTEFGPKPNWYQMDIGYFSIILCVSDSSYCMLDTVDSCDREQTCFTNLTIEKLKAIIEFCKHYITLL